MIEEKLSLCLYIFRFRQ